MTGKTAVAIRHVEHEGLGNLTAVLTQHNFAVQYLDVWRDDLAKFNPLAPDLLIVLGGPMGVYEADRYPFLITEIKLLQKRVAADLPTLGICLGSQLIAQAIGGNVYKGPNKEIGWYDLQLTMAGQHTFFEIIAANHLKIFHWHGDTFDLPTGAQLLASSALYKNQAFLFKNNIWGLQFHIEVTQENIEQWLKNSDGELTAGIDKKKLHTDTKKFNKDMQVSAQQFWQAWLQNVNNSRR